MSVKKDVAVFQEDEEAYIVEDEKNLALSRGRRGQCALCERRAQSRTGELWGSLASKQGGGRAVQRPDSRTSKYHFEEI